jgi:low affinity Fe/Cu permease
LFGRTKALEQEIDEFLDTLSESAQAVLGIGLLKRGRGFRWMVLGRIALGWVVPPIVVDNLCFVALFFLQNVFNQEVYDLSIQGVEQLELPKPRHLAAALPSAA